MATPTIDSTRSSVIKDVQDAVEAFRNTPVFGTEKLHKAFMNVAEKRRQLENAFPQLANMAHEFYHAEFPDEPDNLKDHEDAVFSVLLSLWSFVRAETVDDFDNTLDNLNNGLFALTTWCEGYNSERGYWESDLENTV